MDYFSYYLLNWYYLYWIISLSCSNPKALLGSTLTTRFAPLLLFPDLSLIGREVFMYFLSTILTQFLSNSNSKNPLLRSRFFTSLGKKFDTDLKVAYYEDVSKCYEVREKGYKTIYQPKSVLIHHEGVTNGRDENEGIKRYQIINKEIFHRKHLKNLDLKKKTFCHQYVLYSLHPYWLEEIYHFRISSIFYDHVFLEILKVKHRLENSILNIYIDWLWSEVVTYAIQFFLFVLVYSRDVRMY